MRMTVSTSKRFLALLVSAILCLTAIGAECFRSFIIAAETNTDDIVKEASFQFNSEDEIQASYYPSSSKKPTVTDDNGVSALSIFAYGGNVSHIQFPFALHTDTTYHYVIRYRVVSQEDSNTSQANTTVLQLYSTAKKEGYSNSSKIVDGQTALATPFSWKALTISESYETIIGSFTTNSTTVTDELKYLTLYYKTNKGLEQQLYIDSVKIFTEVSDTNGDTVFEFENPSEMKASYYASSAKKPIVTEDNSISAMSMIADGTNVAHIQLPYVLRAGIKYNYSIKYRVVSQADSNTSQANTTVLQLYSTAKKEGYSNSSKVVNGQTVLTNLFNWKALTVSESYETITGSFTTDSTTVTDELKYLTLYYKTNKGLTQILFIDNISISIDPSSLPLEPDEPDNPDTPDEPFEDKIGSYIFEFDNSGELAQPYAAKGTNLPKVSKDGNKNVLEMNSDGKAYARLPFKLEVGKTYEYSISYRVVSQGDSEYDKTTVLKLRSGKKVESGSPVEVVYDLSTVLSWQKLQISDTYITVNGTFIAKDSNVTNEYQYLTLHYETNKNFAQTMYIDKIVVKSYDTPDAMDDVTGSYEFDFNDEVELAYPYANNSSNLPKVSVDGDKNVLELNSYGKAWARLPFKLEVGKTYEYSISYRIASQGDSSYDKTTLLKLRSGKKVDSGSPVEVVYDLSTVLSWQKLQISDTYITVNGTFIAKDSNVTNEYQYLTLHYETNKNFAQTMYIDKIVVESYDTPVPMDDVTGKYDFEFDNLSELAYSYSTLGANIPTIIDDGGKKVLKINSATKAEARLPFKLEAGKIYRYSITYRVTEQGDSAYDKTTVFKLVSGKKTENGSSIGDEKTYGLSTIFNWKKLEVSQGYQTLSGSFTTTQTNVTNEYCYLTLSYKTWKNFIQPIYIDKISIWEYTLPEARNTNTNPVTFEFDNMDDIDYATNNTANTGIDPITGKEVLHINVTMGGVAVRLPYKIKADMAYRITINYRLDKTVEDKYYLQLVSGTREFDPYFWRDAEEKAYLLKEAVKWKNLTGSEAYTALPAVLFVKASDVANDNGWLTLRLKCGIKFDVNCYIDSITISEMTYSEASHLADIQDYNWSAKQEDTVKYIDWENWVTKAAPADSKDGTKSVNLNDSSNIGIILGIVSATVVAVIGVFLLILFRKKRRRQKTA